MLQENKLDNRKLREDCELLWNSMKVGEVTTSKDFCKDLQGESFPQGTMLMVSSFLHFMAKSNRSKKLEKTNESESQKPGPDPNFLKPKPPQGKAPARHTKAPEKPGTRPPSGRHNYMPDAEEPNVLPDDDGNADPTGPRRRGSRHDLAPDRPSGRAP